MLMNPLDLHGPQFLFFYLVVGVLTLLFVRNRIKNHEAQGTIPKLNLTDPYKIALLRGGEKEALRVAVVSLIDRGLLNVTGETMQTKHDEALGSVRRPIEKAILTEFSFPSRADEMYDNPMLRAACAPYREALRRDQFLATSKVYASRLPFILLGVVILGGFAGAKVIVALQRGRHNILLLVMLAIVFMISLLKFYSEERTGLGDRVLADLRTLFKGLKTRSYAIKSGGQTNEAALLAAVFGMSALATAKFPHVKKLFPRAYKTTNSSGCASVSCGSSCSSGGSGCGGGCGGGGCGGCGGN